jgi:hypothetical protein
MSLAEFKRYKIGVDLYEARNQEDKVIISVKETKDGVRVHGIEVTGLMAFSDFDKYLASWIVVDTSEYMFRFIRDKKITSGQGALLPARSNRKFNVRLVYLGHSKGDNQHTMIICTERNKDYRPHFDVSDDPR